MRVLLKKHKAQIKNGEIQVLDEGRENGYEVAPNKDMIQNANFVSGENTKIQTIHKKVRSENEEFEMVVKYLVE